MSIKRNKDGLTEHQVLFVDNYLRHGNAALAVRESGYSKSCSARQAVALLALPTVKAEIVRRRDELRQFADNTVSPEWILSNVIEVIQRCMTKKPVMTGGKPCGEWRFDARGAMRGLELLGKHIGLFTDEQVPQPSVNLALILDGLQRGGVQFNPAAKIPMFTPKPKDDDDDADSDES